MTKHRTIALGSALILLLAAMPDDGLAQHPPPPSDPSPGRFCLACEGPGRGGGMTVGEPTHGRPPLGVEHGHAAPCMPGVYRTEVEGFRGRGYVARRRPYTSDQDTMARAGHPDEISPLARYARGSTSTGYFVGGGASFLSKRGHPRLPYEGTWGWDDQHLGAERRVRLNFSRGALRQDGAGQYEPDPPFEIPNVFAIRYGERLHRLLGNRE